MSKLHFPWRGFILVVSIALVARLLLLASDAVSFHADEAVVGLMAKHILQGERPTFFYGQAYMGSLDPWLIALGFRLLGESVLTIRLVQSLLYLLVVAAGFVLAWRLSARAIIAVVTGLLLAVPPVNTALYTTATLGGYNETLLFGTLILLLAYEVTHDFPRSYWRWALLGLCAGLGWWTNGLIVVYLLPAAILIVYALIRALKNPQPSAVSDPPSAPRTSHPAPSFPSELGTRNSELKSQSLVLSPQSFLFPLLLAVLAFIVGSAPWWVFDFTHDHAALATYLTNRQSGEFAGVGLPYVPPGQRAIGLVFIGLPALVGMRFPWSSDYFLPPLGILVVLVCLIAVYRLARGHNPLKPDARGLVLGILGLFCVVFVASSFGADPTGRYFLPLHLPLSIVLASFISHQLSSASIHQKSADESSPASTQYSVLSTQYLNLSPQSFSLIFVALLLAYNALGQVAAAGVAPGLTTQFDLVSHISNQHDEELIAFLDQQGLYNGYTNYWVAFRLAFLTSERMQYSAALPYKTSLDYNPADNRYPPYVEAADSADRIAVITTNAPELDARLTAHFAALDLTYREQRIGAFHIYYDFQPQQPRPPLW
jgi:4-amino-4-deoxy-L-arabinose transferase-like glycosyltransferase